MTNNIYSAYNDARKINPIYIYIKEREPKPADMKRNRESKPQPPRTAEGKPRTRRAIRTSTRGDRPP